jgi:ABC-type sugar transport system permease subunit
VPDGLLNQAIRAVSFGAWEGADWLNNPATAMPAIMLMSIWQAVGFHMVIWLAGLQTIPGELYEAAAMDGAQGWELFRNITWPGLRSTRTFILITITIASFSLFTQISVMTQGGPLDSTTTVVFMAVRTGYEQQATGYAAAVSLVFFVIVVNVIASLQIFAEVWAMFQGRPSAGPSAQRASLMYVPYLFQRAFQDFQLGYASALAWGLFVIVLGITLLQLWLSKRWVYYEGG